MILGGLLIVLFYITFLRDVSERDGCHDIVSIFDIFSKINSIIRIIGLITKFQIERWNQHYNAKVL